METTCVLAAMSSRIAPVRLAQFYQALRWPSWREDIAGRSGDSCFSFYPFLWTKEGSLATSHREEVPVWEAFDLKVELLRQLNEKKSSKRNAF